MYSHFSNAGYRRHTGIERKINKDECMNQVSPEGPVTRDFQSKIGADYGSQTTR